MTDAVAATDADIAAQLDAISALVRRAAATAGADHSRAGMLQSIAFMLDQPRYAAHLLADRGGTPAR